MSRQKGKKGYYYRDKSGSMGVYPDTRGDTGRPSGKDRSPPCGRILTIWSEPWFWISTFDCQSFSKSSTWVSLSPLWSRSGRNCISAVMSKASKNLGEAKLSLKGERRWWTHLSRSCCQAWSTLPAGLRTPRLRKAPRWESLWWWIIFKSDQRVNMVKHLDFYGNKLFVGLQGLCIGWIKTTVGCKTGPGLLRSCHQVPLVITIVIKLAQISSPYMG